MKKGEIYEGVIEKVDFPNKGIVITDGQKVTVKNGMPGQKVRFMINKKRSGRAEGRLLEVLEKSPLETREPVCSIFPECGGCMYQTMSYENQLKMKECQVRELLDGALNGTDYQWEGIHGSPIEFRYRNKMEFSFGDAYKDGPLTLGLHKKGSTYDVLTADDCQLVHEDMTKILTCVHEYFLKRNVSYYKKMQHTGYLRQRRFLPNRFEAQFHYFTVFFIRTYIARNLPDIHLGNNQFTQLLHPVLPELQIYVLPLFLYLRILPDV